MNALTILRSKNIDPEKSVLIISREEALTRLIEAVQEFCPRLKIEEMSKEDLETLIDSLGKAITNYHPENYHQERSALLDNREMLKKYGLTDDEIGRLDFV